MTRVAFALAIMWASWATWATATPASANGMIGGVNRAARTESRKDEWLADKAAARGRDTGAAAAAKQTFTARLRALIGKPADVPLTIRNLWTREHLAIDLPRPTAPQAGALAAKAALGARIEPLPATTVSSFLRCRFTDDETRIDPRLIPVVIRAALSFNSSYAEIVSGYRSPKHNLLLRKKGHEVADDSQHSHGNAVDFRLAGVPTKKLRDWVKTLKLGGVGYYPQSSFIHADVGPIRSWVGK